MRPKLYLVGGAVRDQLRGRDPKDFDYVIVGATEEQLRAKYGPPVGGAFPVFLDKTTGAEIAMARREKKSGSGYKGFSVEFGPDVTLEEDLYRRDLTINSIAKDLDSGDLIDPYGGAMDLRAGILRATSPAFVEDPLRVLRVARFAAQFDFRIDPGTAYMASRLRDELSTLPAERIAAELLKALKGARPSRFVMALSEMQVLDAVMPELFTVRPDILMRSVGQMDFVRDTAAECWGTLVGHLSPDAAQSLGKRLRLPRELIEFGVKVATCLPVFLNGQHATPAELVWAFEKAGTGGQATDWVAIRHIAAQTWSFGASMRIDHAHRMFLEVTPQQAIAAGMKGKQIAEWIREARIQKIRKTT